MTTRDDSGISGRLEQIQVAMAKGDPPPSDVRKYEMQLAGILGSLAREATLCQIEFNKVLAASRIGAKSMAEAKAIAETQPAYARLLAAEQEHEACKQMLITCRSHGRSLSEEMRLQK